MGLDPSSLITTAILIIIFVSILLILERFERKLEDCSRLNKSVKCSNTIENNDSKRESEDSDLKNQTELMPQFKCLICGEKSEITNDGVIVCEKCKTPHHKECYNWIGHCGVYGCKGKPVGSQTRITPYDIPEGEGEY